MRRHQQAAALLTIGLVAAWCGADASVARAEEFASQYTSAT
jgi:hypothetical protein